MSTTPRIRRVLAAPDKFKGTASAAEVAAAIGHACWELGIECIERPMADGGDGILDVLGGPNRTTTVTGPLGDPISAGWRLTGDTAVIEMAQASGLVAAGGRESNRPLDATTTGTGELIDHALDAGVKRMIVGLGGSASTDGGFGAIRAINAIARLKRVELLVACDVTTSFVEAASVFGPAEGSDAGAGQTARTASRATRPDVRRRLRRRRDRHRRGRCGRWPRSGTRCARGATRTGLRTDRGGGRRVRPPRGRASRCDRSDRDRRRPSRSDEPAGKVVGGFMELGAEHDIAVAAIVGSAEADVLDQLGGAITVAALTDVVDIDAAMTEPKQHIETAARRLIESLR